MYAVRIVSKEGWAKWTGVEMKWVKLDFCRLGRIHNNWGEKINGQITV